MQINLKKYLYLLFFILFLLVVGFGLIVLSPNVISILLSVGYIIFFTLSKTTHFIDKELFIIRYEKAFFLIVLLIVAIIQFTINDAVRSLPLILMGFLFLIIAYVIFSWIYEKIKTIRELKNEMLNSELSLLRSQINPHFFFNTLNNLYGLAIEKSDETPKFIHKLSEMMRYTIYDCKKETVTLENEINFLKNYIDLHSIRHFEKLKTSFHLENENSNLEIAPLLLINLVENAFKHGAEKMDKGAFINISLTTHKNLLNFSIENNYDHETNIERGIGLSNMQRRLDLRYANKHNFNISKNHGIFRAELSLTLEE